MLSPAYLKETVGVHIVVNHLAGILRQSFVVFKINRTPHKCAKNNGLEMPRLSRPSKDVSPHTKICAGKTVLNTLAHSEICARTWFPTAGKTCEVEIQNEKTRDRNQPPIFLAVVSREISAQKATWKNPAWECKLLGGGILIVGLEDLEFVVGALCGWHESLGRSVLL